MNSTVLARAALLVLLAAPASAQVPAPAPVLLATGDYLFVLRDGVLFQFDVHTLALRGQVRLPDAVAASPEVRGKPEVRGEEHEVVMEEPVLRDTEVVETEPVDRAAPAPTRGRRRHAITIRQGLDWLQRHQEADGSWDADGFMKHDTRGAPSDGPGKPLRDVGATGLALLAFLGDGSTLRSGPHREVVKRGVAWLRAQQGEDGLLGAAAGHDSMYDHCIATIALCEAFGLSDFQLLRPVAQRAIDYILEARNPYKVWRYNPRDGNNDTSVTAWALTACKAAQSAGLEIDANVMRYAAAWFDEVTDPATGRAGYTKRGEPSSRHPGGHARTFPPDRGEALTAAALYGRFLIGQDPRQNPVMMAAAKTLLAAPPSWDREAGTIDFYYWYYGTQAMLRIGDPHWRHWSSRLADVLVVHQRRDGNFAGSWDPVGVWGEDGGRIYSTALALLSLEAGERHSVLRSGG